MPVDPRTPCLVGAAQRTWRGAEDAPEPLDMWDELARAAAADAGAPDAVRSVDRLEVVHCLTWPYDDPPGRLAQRLGADPPHQRSGRMGGESPMVLAAEAAEAIARGRSDLALIASGEALATMRRARKEHRRLPWSHRLEGRPPIALDVLPHASELAHGVLQAYLTFPLFDSARRARLGTGLDAYRAELGVLLSGMSQVAAENPHAWFPTARGAREIVTATTDNRMVGYPYTKYMVAVIDVDMAGALLLASHERADELGVPTGQRVYLRGWAQGSEAASPAARPDLSRSPGIEAVSAVALEAAGVDVDAVAHLDLYSCFSSSVLLACDALGLDPAGRQVTVTGGLPYAGGPASGYLVHSIAAMAQRLREDPGAFGLTSGVGLHMTKHAYGVWSTSPGTFQPFDAEHVSKRLAQDPERELRSHATGSATVVAYSVAHGRAGLPEWGLLVCELDDTARVYAKITDPSLLEEAERCELVGTRVDLEPGEANTNLARA